MQAAVPSGPAEEVDAHEKAVVAREGCRAILAASRWPAVEQAEATAASWSSPAASRWSATVEAVRAVAVVRGERKAAGEREKKEKGEGRKKGEEGK